MLSTITQQQFDQYYKLLENTLKRLDLLNDPTCIYNWRVWISDQLKVSKKVIVPKYLRHTYQT
jgi:hypothetical protein